MKNRKLMYVLMLVLLSVFFTHITSTTFAQLQPSCFTPGTQVVSDANESVTTQLDIESVSAAEPFYSDGVSRLAITLKTETLSPQVAASWNVFIDTPDGAHRFVQMSNLNGGVQFRYGTVAFLLGMPTFTYQGDVQGVFQNDGSIRFVIERSKLGNPATGQNVTLSGATYIKVLLDLVQIDSTPSNNYSLLGSDGCAPFRIAQFGANADIPVAADYNRNGTTDFAVWRPATGSWFVTDSVTGEFGGAQWGNGDLGDIPVVGDFDGDGVSDITVWRPETGVWYSLLSGDASVKITGFGMPEDIPVIGDYDGDRKSDVAIWRPSTGSWYVSRSSDGGFQGMQFGIGTDRTAQGDYDGDGKCDYAVYRPESAYWYVFRSNSQDMTVYQWGASEDKVQPGDYNGNGRADYAVWRPSNGVWYVSLN